MDRKARPQRASMELQSATSSSTFPSTEFAGKRLSRNSSEPRCFPRRVLSKEGGGSRSRSWVRGQPVRHGVGFRPLSSSAMQCPGLGFGFSTIRDVAKTRTGSFQGLLSPSCKHGLGHERFHLPRISSVWFAACVGLSLERRQSPWFERGECKAVP